VTPFSWLAAIVLFVQLPIPLFGFVVHPPISCRPNHCSAGYASALLVAWVPAALFLVIFRRELFPHAWPAASSAIRGFALLFFEAWIFWRVKGDLGASRLIGRTELSGGGEVVRQAIYARIRHPRYVGSCPAIVGACFLAGTQ
jgi:protein-S-isoprenylcysteine O-methyltransferase Ste14